MLRQVSAQDLKISSITIPGCPRGYVIGDLLWTISSERFVKYESMRRAIAKHLPDSILGRYVELHQPGDRCPQGSRLRQCIEEYGRQLQDPYILSVSQEVMKEKTLCVHMRCGDRGIGPMRRTLKAIEVLHGAFDSVIVLTGFHAVYNSYSVARREAEMKHSLKYLRKALRISEKVRICLEGTADDHLFILSKARHLLLSKGGFSRLAGISAQGHVYIPRYFGERWRAELHPNVTLEHVDIHSWRIRQTPGIKLEARNTDSNGNDYHLISNRTKKSYPINTTAAMVWECCGNDILMSELVQEFIEMYPEATLLEQDIIDLLEQFHDYGLVQIYS